MPKAVDEVDEDEDDPEYPAPPTKFRCNRGRMLLTIRVALHHVGACQLGPLRVHHLHVARLCFHWPQFMYGP